uniref:Uncharacterized protein n=1 Tax=Cannabis sativa TaxID=3483 RepID=A0A803PKR1_CANSA
MLVDNYALNHGSMSAHVDDYSTFDTLPEGHINPASAGKPIANFAVTVVRHTFDKILPKHRMMARPANEEKDAVGDVKVQKVKDQGEVRPATPSDAKVDEEEGVAQMLPFVAIMRKESQFSRREVQQEINGFPTIRVVTMKKMTNLLNRGLLENVECFIPSPDALITTQKGYRLALGAHKHYKLHLADFVPKVEALEETGSKQEAPSKEKKKRKAPLKIQESQPRGAEREYSSNDDLPSLLVWENDLAFVHDMSQKFFQALKKRSGDTFGQVPPTKRLNVDEVPLKEKSSVESPINLSEEVVSEVELLDN